MKELQRSLKILRNDAIERRLGDLAIVYGWSEIRLGEQILNRQMTDSERYRMCLQANTSVRQTPGT